MKFGFRIPSLKRRLAARTSIKRYMRHSLGLKAPRGWGLLTNPKRAIYNRIYYRTTFGVEDVIRFAHKQHRIRLQNNHAQYTEKSYNEDEEIKIKSADITHFDDSTADALLEEIRHKHQLFEHRLAFLGISIILLLLFWIASVSAWVVMSYLIFCIPGYLYFRGYDQERKTVFLTYDIDRESKHSFDDVEKAFATLESCATIWSVTSQHATTDWKYHGGATDLIKRHRAELRQELPKYFVSNVTPYSFKLYDQKFYFFPDRILIYQGNEVAAIRYSELQITTRDTIFVEDDPVPIDAVIVGHTWQHPNKNGGPDRRFSYNPQIPQVIYNEIRIQTSSGLDVLIQCSKRGIGHEFIRLIHSAAKHN